MLNICYKTWRWMQERATNRHASTIRAMIGTTKDHATPIAWSEPHKYRGVSVSFEDFAPLVSDILFYTLPFTQQYQYFFYFFLQSISLTSHRHTFVCLWCEAFSNIYIQSKMQSLKMTLSIVIPVSNEVAYTCLCIDY